MANTLNGESKLWILDTTDILTGTSICVRKVQMASTTAADLGTFYSLTGAAPDHDNFFVDLDFDSNTIKITDASSGGKWTAIAANDWVHITECSEPLNNGWYYLKTATDANNFNIEESKFPFTAGDTKSARIRTYTPEICMRIVADTGGGSGTPLLHPTVDWGDKGRWFRGLSYLEGTSDTHSIYLYFK